METHAWQLKVFVLVVNLFLTKTEENIKIKQNDDKSNKMFTDVIKNISRVNNVLQDLINNYEQLKKIYNSQENLDSRSTDFEIDEVFKVIQEKKRKNRSDKGTISKTDDSFPATKMIWSDDDDNENIDDIEKATETNVHSSEVVHEKLKDTYKIDTKKETNQIQSHPKVIFIETFKKNFDTKMNSEINLDFGKQRKPVHMKITPSQLLMKNTEDKSSPERPNSKEYLRSGSISDVKKVVYAEAFPAAKIWHQITNNKPIKLEPQDEAIRYDQSLNEPRISKRSKSALIIISNSNNKRLASNSIETYEKYSTESVASESTDEEAAFTKDLLKLSVLRQAYGEACLKMVVRKCHKACKKVQKTVCRRFKCKSNFKDKFSEYAKSGCIEQFSASGRDGLDLNFKGVDDIDNDENHNINYRANNGSFVDLTRSEYLDMACLPYVKNNKQYQKHTLLKNETPFSLNPINEGKKPNNILRDRYEKACKRQSAKRCNAACTVAYTTACNSYSCVKSRKKAFRKECKRQCKIVYRVSSSSSSTDSSSSGSDSSSSSTS